MPATFENIQTYTVVTDQPSITFSNISQSYTDLMLVATSSIPAGAAFSFQCGNGTINTSAIYNRTFIYATSSAFPSGRASSQTQVYFSSGDTSGIFGQSTVHIQNYSSATVKKLLLAVSGDGKDEVAAQAVMIDTTSAINIITVTGYLDNILAGSTFTLYGIKSA
jgi:hypothetical protein